MDTHYPLTSCTSQGVFLQDSEKSLLALLEYSRNSLVTLLEIEPLYIQKDPLRVEIEPFQVELFKERLNNAVKDAMFILSFSSVFSLLTGNPTPNPKPKPNPNPNPNPNSNPNPNLNPNPNPNSLVTANAFA